MTAFTPRRALPVAAALAAAGFVATALAHVVVVGPTPAPRHPADFGVFHAELRECMARGDRTHDDCLDEIEGKALIQRAEWLAQADERRGVRHASTDDDIVDFVDLADASPPRARAR